MRTPLATGLELHGSRDPARESSVRGGEAPGRAARKRWDVEGLASDS